MVIGDYKLTVRADRPVATRLYAGGAPFQPVRRRAGGGTRAAARRPSACSPRAPPPAAPRRRWRRPRRCRCSPRRPAPVPAVDAHPAGHRQPGAGARRHAGRRADHPGAHAGRAGPGRRRRRRPARLVVISTSLAGTEFSLDRPSLVIGRTPENDIVLNHKSISRHHAKIIRDGDKYIVVDLESANGVRVNGVGVRAGRAAERGHGRARPRAAEVQRRQRLRRLRRRQRRAATGAS